LERSIVISHRGAPELLRWLRSVLDGVGTVRELFVGDELEAVLREQPPPDLVVASTGLSIPSAISVLVAARAAGVVVPFIIIAGFKDDRVRAFVSAAVPRGFEHRVLSRDDLLNVASVLMTPHPRAEAAGKPDAGDSTRSSGERC
jgi:hypothetical protein